MDTSGQLIFCGLTDLKFLLHTARESISDNIYYTNNSTSLDIRMGTKPKNNAKNCQYDREGRLLGAPPRASPSPLFPRPSGPPRPGLPTNKRLLKARRDGPNTDRRYSDINKTDEPIKTYADFFLSRTWMFFLAQNGEITYNFSNCFTSLCALVRSAHDEFMHVHD